MSGPGTVYVQGQLLLSDAADRTIGRKLETSGVATWSDSGTICLAADTGVLSNTGLFDVKNDGVLYSYGGAACVNNSGIFRKSSGTGTSYFYTAFNNSGTVEAQSGTMYFGGIFTQTAGLVSVLRRRLSQQPALSPQTRFRTTAPFSFAVRPQLAI